MERLSAEALALQYLRSFVLVLQKDLAARLGYASDKPVSRFESGATALTRERLEEVVAPLGMPPESVDVLLLTYSLISLLDVDGEAEPGPLGLDREERRAIVRATLAATATFAEEMAALLIQRKRQEKAAAARREAEEVVPVLLQAPKKERRRLVEIFPEYQGWAVAEKLAHESVRRAAHDAGEALEVAELALSVAEQLAEDGSRAAAQGYCWAIVGNARRVGNDFDGSDAAFTQAWERWRAGSEAGRALFAEWRMLDLEASLRRAQQRFEESLALLEEARKLVEHDDLAVGRILLKREHVFERMGDFAAALHVLDEAAPRIEAAGDRRLRFLLCHKTALNLCHLERFAEAAALLPEVRELALQQPKADLDWTRVLWLDAKIEAGQGNQAQATQKLERVRQELTKRRLHYDAALASLDLAVLLLEAGRTAEVRELAMAMTWIFEAKRIRREALVALRLFCEAAEREAASAELARRTIAELLSFEPGSAPRPAGRP